MTPVITDMFHHYFLAEFLKYHLQKWILKSKEIEGRKKTEPCFHVHQVTQIKSVEETLSKNLSVGYLLQFAWQNKDGN